MKHWNERNFVITKESDIGVYGFCGDVTCHADMQRFFYDGILRHVNQQTAGQFLRWNRTSKTWLFCVRIKPQNIISIPRDKIYFYHFLPSTNSNLTVGDKVLDRIVI